MRPLCKLLENDVVFKFDDGCLAVFLEIKKKLISVTITIVWEASDYAIRAVLGQRRDEVF